MKQSSFFKSKDFPKEFGGELLKGKRKSRRPLSTKRPAHLVLRAQGERTIFLKNKNFASSTIRKFAQKFGIKIYQLGIEFDHVHAVIRFEDRTSYNAFVRATAGTLAKKLKFAWLYRPFTRVLEWGCDFKRACSYVFQNELEAQGLIRYQKRGRGAYARTRERLDGRLT